MVKTKNYQNGKIYQVVSSSFDMCYIGSTIDKLSNRMNSHRSKYRKYKEGKGGFISIYDMFDKYGESNCKIYLIENYPCQSQEELFAREGFHQKNNDCINKNISGRSHREYMQDNRERLAEYYNEWKNNNQEHLKQYKATHYKENKDHYQQKGKEWRENNKERKKEQDKKYREEHKEKLKQYFKTYDQINKEKKQAYRQQKYTCECGAILCLSSKSHHFKTKQHQNWLKQQEPEQEEEHETVEQSN